MEVIINGKKIEGREGETILSVAEKNGIIIPTLCFHSDLKIRASCRLCVVDVKGNLVPACKTKIEEGMEITTSSSVIEKTRKINLELLFSQHQEECFDCIWNLNCKMLDLAKEYGVEINRFDDRKKTYPVYHFGSSLEFDSSKCIDCRNCVEMCEKQGVEFLEIRGRSHLFEVFPSKKEDKDCIYCGQCIVHCPAGAFEAVGEFEGIEKPFKKIGKKVVFQIAPAVRVTIGEEFGMPYGTLSLGKLVASLKKIGAEKVFDVSTGADITTIEESKEFLEKVKDGNLPLFTACCPSWVRFVEFYYPEFIPHLTSVRSPHIILGSLIKKDIAKREGIDINDVLVVSVMPCVSKKHEVQREELKVEGVFPVDYVMTTREVGRLIKKNGIDFKNIEEEKTDDSFGDPSGSGVSYGVSGGVMQSAYHNVTGKELNFEEVKKGVKKAEVVYDGKKLNLAVVHGLGNGKEILEELKKDPGKYDYVEVMACYGGCIGGGGQSVPFDETVRQKRAKGLCKTGSEKEVKKAEDNPIIKKIYKDHMNYKEDISKICHTSYYKANKTRVRESEQGKQNDN